MNAFWSTLPALGLIVAPVAVSPSHAATFAVTRLSLDALRAAELRRLSRMAWTRA
jgi:uncharacterized membrane protein YesL